MKYPNSKWTVRSPAAAALAVSMVLASARGIGRMCGAQTGPPAGDLASFSALAPIDAHVHLYKDDPAFGALMQRLNLRILNICVIDDRDPYGKGLEPQRGDVLKVVHSTGGRAVLCTTFSPYDFEEPGFAQRDDPPTRCRLRRGSHRGEDLQGHGHGDEVESGEICDAG